MFACLPGLSLVRTDPFIVTQLGWLPESDAVLLIKPSELRTARVALPGMVDHFVSAAVPSEPSFHMQPEDSVKEARLPVLPSQ